MSNKLPSLQVGIGVLVGEQPFNNIRLIEIGIALNSGNWRGLQQPPHVTVKRPFVLNDQVTLEKIIKQLEIIAGTIKPFHITYEKIDHFADKVIHLKVSPSKHLEKIHQIMVAAMLDIDRKSKLSGELTSEMIFHTTLSLGLSHDEYERAWLYAEKITSIDFSESFLIKRIGLFMSNDNEHWNVVSDYQLGKPL